MDKPRACNDHRPCFARNGGKCRILSSTYDIDGRCPFCKVHINDKRREEKDTLVLQKD